MQEIIKFFFTVLTTLSLFCANLFCPVTLSPESEDFDFSYLSYPDEAIITLEEA